jgi:RIO kinase 1
MFSFDDDYGVEDNEDFTGLPRIRNMPAERARLPKRGKSDHKPKRSRADVKAELEAQRDDAHEYQFSYDASRHERVWIMDSLGAFHEMHWFEDILRLLEGGKEASVYQCALSPHSPVGVPYLAAKVYRPRRFRNLKNDFFYREGRADLDINGNVVLDDGMQHAMHKRTQYGKELLHTSWIGHEFKTLQVLHAAGADVPEPYASGDNAILMEYLGDDELPAPALNTIDLSPAEAAPLFERVMHNVEIMLAHGRVHGDLSAYNILYWEGEITLIDFPQAISPQENRNAYRVFERDLTRVCEYFARQGVRRDPARLAGKLWSAHKYRLAPEVDPRLLDAEDRQDRRLWQKQQMEG